MRKSILFFVGLLLIAGLCIGTVSAYDQPSQDSQGNWLIGTVSNLQWFAEQVNAGHASYNAKLISDIDLSGVTLTPIGTSTYAYAGVFDGNGKKISRLTSPFFSYTQNGEIKNIEILNSNIESGSYLAIFVERVLGNENIHDCCLVSSSIISSATHTGGFIGDISNSGSTITNCFVYDVTVTTTSEYYSSTFGGYAITNSLVGTISNCYVAESVATYTSSSGVSFGFAPIRSGQVYSNMGTFSNSIFIGDDIKARQGSLIYAGFFCGRGNGQSIVMGNVVNCYHASTATISGTAYPSTGTTTNEYGAPTTEYDTKSFYETTLGWDFTSTWYWDTTDNLPKLQVFNPSTPSISAISVTSSSPAQVGSTVQVSATLSNINDDGEVQFATSTNGNTWTNVGNAVSIASGATSATQTFTGSSTAGLYYVKAILTVGSTTVDSHTSGVTDGQVRLVDTPTITTATITPSIGKLSTAYTPAITIPITGLGGAQTVYYKLQQLSGETWSDISGKAGTATATGSKTLTVSINDASETTHSYRVLVSSLSDYTASVTATSNTVTFTTFAPPATPTAEIRPSTITINTATEVTLTASNVPTAPAGNTYYYQWFYGSTSTPSAGDTAITEQETTLTNPATWSATFTATGTKYVYLKITDAAGNDPVYSPRQTLTISNYAPPTITMVSRQTSSPALTGSDVKVKVIATSYEGTTTHLTYKWYYAVSSASPEWTEISGQTTNILTTQFSTEGTYMLKCVVTDTSISMSTDSYTAGKYATVQIVPQPSISAVAVNPYTLDLSVSTTVQLSASITNPSGVSSLVWQVQKDGGEWTNTPLTLDHGTVTVSSAGTYLYRLQVTPIVGSVITSENTHSVVAGTLPVISIVSPPNNSQYGVGETIQINATGTGVTAIQWSFGDGVKASGNTNTLTPWVQYTGIGIHTITLTAANSFGNKTASIQIIVSSAKRPLATSTPAPIKDANMVYEWMENFNPQSAEDQSPDVMGIFKGLTAPFTNVMGQWFYLALFGIPYLLIWIRTRNTIIPSIIGILFGAWLWVMLPGSAMAAAVCILILSVSGGIFGIYLSRRQRE